MFLLLFQLFLHPHLCIIIKEPNKPGRVLGLLPKVLWRYVVVVIVVRVARENDPGSIHVDVTVQVELVLEVSHVDTVHPDDVPYPEDMREVLNILSEELHLYVGHAPLSGCPGPLHFGVALEVPSLTCSYTDVNLSRAFGIQGIIN
jgi:hypothetical protein